MQHHFPEYEKRFPDLSELYSDLKDRYIKLKLEYIKAKMDNRHLRNDNQALLVRATEAERLFNEQLLRNVHQSAANEGLDARKVVIDKYLGRS